MYPCCDSDSNQILFMSQYYTAFNAISLSMRTHSMIFNIGQLRISEILFLLRSSSFPWYVDLILGEQLLSCINKNTSLTFVY